MSTITAILEADADGTLHLPLPAELRGGKIKVEAKLEAAPPAPVRAKGGLWKGMPNSFWMAADFDAPLEAFKELRKRGGLRHVIPDPVGSQREQRVERPLPDRD